MIKHLLLTGIAAVSFPSCSTVKQDPAPQAPLPNPNLVIKTNYNRTARVNGTHILLTDSKRHLRIDFIGDLDPVHKDRLVDGFLRSPDISHVLNNTLKPSFTKHFIIHCDNNDNNPATDYFAQFHFPQDNGLGVVTFDAHSGLKPMYDVPFQQALTVMTGYMGNYLEPAAGAMNGYSSSGAEAGALIYSGPQIN
jgi:hypothetical protein